MTEFLFDTIRLHSDFVCFALAKSHREGLCGGFCDDMLRARLKNKLLL